MKLSKLTRQRLDQKGLASIVIVAILVVLLSLISIGFARLMSRAVNGSLNNQLSSAAGYAAQSALNDAIAYVQVNPNAKSTTCNGLFSTNNGADRKIISNFVSGNTDYKYSCILVDPSPPSLQYSVPPSQSQVAAINTVDSSGTAQAPGNLLISWQSSGNDVSKTNTSACAARTLYDENTWSTKGCPPLLRVTLYPVSGTTVSQTNSHTYFLYPTNSGGNTLDYNPGVTPDGSIVPVNCTTQPSNPNESTGNNQCSVVISDFGSAVPGLSYFYARLTPLYNQANILIKSNDSSNNILKFQDDQTLIDATAQVGTATKRLQARVAVNNSGDITPQEDALPESGLRAAEAICKRLDVNGNSVTTQGTFCSTQQTIIQTPPPTVTFCVDSGGDCSANGYSPTTTTVNDSDQPTLRWSVSGATQGCTNAGSIPLAWSNPSGDSTSNTQTNPLSGGDVDGGGKDYTFKLTCTNPGGSTSEQVTVHVNATSSSGAPCSNNCGTPTSPGSCNSVVNVSWDGTVDGNGDLHWHAEDDPDCGYGIHYCDAETPVTAYGIFDNGNDNPLDASTNDGNPGYATTVKIGCEDLAGNWGWSDSYNGSGTNNPGSPQPYWISKGITYTGAKGPKSKGVASWCDDNDPQHGAVVCGVYATGNEDKVSGTCNLYWDNFDETQYDGVVDTTGRFYTSTGYGRASPNKPGFLLGFPSVLDLSDNDNLRISCTALNDWTWYPEFF